MNFTPSSIDGAIFFILLIFAVLAFLKGFVKDFFATLNLLIAIIASYALTPVICKFFLKEDSLQMMIDIGVRFVLFVVILIIVSIFSSKISTPLVEKIPNSVNQSLGFGFGFAKGYFILAFVFAIFLSLYSGSPKSSQKEKLQHQKAEQKIGPASFRESKSYAILFIGADKIKPFVEKALNQIRNGAEPKRDKSLKGGVDSIDEILQTKKLYDQLLEEDSAPANPSSTAKEVRENKDQNNSDLKIDNSKQESGYTKQEIEKMKRLIEIMSN